MLVENGDIVRKSVLPEGMEEIVDLTILQQDSGESVSEAINSFNQSDDIDERLIEEVRRREPLYNFRLFLAQRVREQTKQMWQDISIELNGNALYYVLYLRNHLIYIEMNIYKSFVF